MFGTTGSSIIRMCLLALGEFQFDDDGILDANYNYMFCGWALFILATVFNFVIMTNLLISIFSRVYENYE